MSATQLTCSTVITLVHGTSQPKWLSWFGLKRFKTDEHDWVRASSAFSKKLSENSPPGVQIRSFFWSGDNSHAARITAAEQLQAHIRYLRLEFPDAEQFCVGHSHGGSVIYYALNDSAVEDDLLGYAFLSTPFLNFQRRRYGSIDGKEWVLVALAIASVVLPAYGLAIWRGWSLFGWRPTFAAALLMIPFAAYSRIYRRRAAQDRQNAEKFLNAIPSPYCASDKAVFVRTPGDEASNGLGIVYLFAWLQTRSQVEAERFLQRLEAQREQFKSGRANAFGRLLVSIAIINATAAWSFMSARLCLKAFSLGFGPDVSRHAPFLQITAEATPPGKWTVRQLLPDGERDASLAHTSYDHPEVPVLLGRWICTQMEHKNSHELSATS